jgi:regulatory protein
MARISAITPDPRRPGRFAIVVDGRAEASVSIEAIERLHLRVGREYADVASAVEAEAAALQTYDRAVTMLAARGRSTAELRRLLVRKGEPPAHVEAAIERLLAQGYLDDESFARQFARSKALGAGLSRRRLQQELARKGVTRAVADEAIGDVMASEDIDADAIVDDVARRKLRTLRDAEPAVRRRRLYAHLARRGYDADAIRAAMDRALGRGAEEMGGGEDQGGE